MALVTSVLGAGLLAACTHSPPGRLPDEPRKAGDAPAPGAGSSLLAAQAPLRALGVYLDGLHFRSGDMSDQMDVHHYCGALSEDLIQCVLFDGNGPAARMVGVEYVVSARLFARLPVEERSLWHSHRYEVKSGQLVAPGMPELEEHRLMEKLVSTYGKTWHTWASDPDLPLGPPALMMGFTGDGQARPELLEARDRALGVSSAAKKAARADIPDAPILPGADGWQYGSAVRLKLEGR
jgi:hypothetical protein